MTTRAAFRGQPLVALFLLIGGWIAIRLLTWEPFALERAIERPAGLSVGAGPAPSQAAEAVAPQPADRAPPPTVTWPIAPPAPYRAVLPPPNDPGAAPPIPPAARFAPEPGTASAPAAPVQVGIAAGHQLLWMSAVASVPLPASLSARLAAPLPVAVTRPSVWRDPRWSADGWLLLRRDGGSAVAAGGLAPPSYGASQAGAVVRYRLAPDSANRPVLYLRGSAALSGVREREAAFGASVRPIAGLPVVVAAEARINAQPGATRVRPAAFAYTEFAPVELPLGARAEFYGQAGYVGGNFASAFADGQLRVDRRVAAIGRAELRAGGGVWGGAQKGASRLDLGPAATLGLPLGGSAGARVGVDWRFRVAGNAAPSSGPALTLSAGF